MFLKKTPDKTNLIILIILLFCFPLFAEDESTEEKSRIQEVKEKIAEEKEKEEEENRPFLVRL